MHSLLAGFRFRVVGAMVRPSDAPWPRDEGRPPTLWLRSLLILPLVLGGMLTEAGAQGPGEWTPEQHRLQQRAYALQKQATAVYWTAQLIEAVSLQDQARKILEALYPEATYPKGHPDLASCLLNLGAFLRAKGDHAAARAYLERAVAMYGKLYPSGKEALLVLGASTVGLSGSSGGPGPFLAAAALVPGRTGQGHPCQAAGLHELGNALHGLRDYSRARQYLERAVAMYEALYPPEGPSHGHPDLAASLSDLGALFFVQEDYSKAQTRLEQAVAMYEALYPGRPHPGLAQSLHNLGLVFHAQLDFPNARKCLERAIEKQKAIYRLTGRSQLALVLYHLGIVFRDEENYPRAQEYLEQARAMYEIVYPQPKYPAGHPHFAMCLHNLGVIYQKQGNYPLARERLDEAVRMYKDLYPLSRFRQGHADLAAGLNDLGNQYRAEGDFAGARAHLEQALKMNEDLYPSARYPQGHPRLAATLTNLGHLCSDQGDYPRARAYLERALQMYETQIKSDRHLDTYKGLTLCVNSLGILMWAQGDFPTAQGYLERALQVSKALYSPPKCPNGHPYVAAILSNLGILLQDRRDFAGAQARLEQALKMYEDLYPPDKPPYGHPDLAIILHNLGNQLRKQKDYRGARVHLDRALKMAETFYPKDRPPHGHPLVAASLTNLGLLLKAERDFRGAQDYLERAVRLNETLYPATAYPYGHPELARSLHNLGALLWARGNYRGAQTCLERALTMHLDLGDAFLPVASEAESFYFTAHLPLTHDTLLSLSRQLPDSPAAIYDFVWRSKGAIFHTLCRRQQALAFASDPTARRCGQEWLATRWQLSRVLWKPSTDFPHIERSHRLAQRKEELERRLAGLLPEYRRQQELQHLSATQLVQQLPPQTAFIDLLRYIRFEQDPHHVGKPCYVAFVLRPDQSIERVELDAADQIDTAVDDWRRDLKECRPTSAAAQKLRRLLWRPLAEHLAADTRIVFLAPVGPLTRLPWAALPGDRPGTVLLERYAFAVVPHGPFLLDRLMAPHPAPSAGDLLLAVGNVDYGGDAGSVPLPQGIRRPVARGSGSVLVTPERIGLLVGSATPSPWPALPLLAFPPRRFWPELSGTRKELEMVKALAGPRPVLLRCGTQATTSRLLDDLPKARWAVLLTHGFFADAPLRSELQVDERLFQARGWSGGMAPGTRNPLVLSGLVLAGANRPPRRDQYDVPQDDGGLLTSEAIAGLPLPNLELVVLSACDTGLGVVAGNEGVFGLQRAFHLAGAHSVVASLWKVDDDECTQLLLGRFYANLWQKGMAPAEALQEAQLWIWKKHGPGISDHPYFWAAWVLSGDPGNLGRGMHRVPPTSLVTGNDVVFGALASLGLLVGLAVWARRRNWHY